MNETQQSEEIKTYPIEKDDWYMNQPTGSVAKGEEWIKIYEDCSDEEKLYWDNCDCWDMLIRVKKSVSCMDKAKWGEWMPFYR